MVKNGCAAYHLAPTVCTLADIRHALMNIGNGDVRIQNELGLERDEPTATEQRYVGHTLKT